MTIVAVQNQAGVDYESYIASFGDTDPFTVAFTPIVGGTTITLNLGGGRSVIFTGVFSGSAVYNGSGPVTQVQFLLNGVPDVTATAMTFTLEGIRSGILNGEAALRAVFFADAYQFTGNAGADLFISGDQADNLMGFGGADSLTAGLGNDTLNGGEGNDTLVGGFGNDTFINPNSGDTLVELNGVTEGIDTVQSATTFSLVPHVNIENIRLTGNANANASGNDAANRLIGNTGNNILNGGNGIDTMTGGAGNDTYYVNHASDQTIEIGATGAAEGIDLVSSSVSRTLSANIENLNLSGTANLQGNGNTLANIINGNSGENVLRGYEGNDTLNGLGGKDILLGGTGRDTLNPGSDAVLDIVRFSTVLDSTGTLRDMVIGMDLNGEDKFDFPAIPASPPVSVGAGVLNAATFNADLALAVNAALNPNGAVLFDPTGGDQNVAGHSYLVVDANGDGSYTSGADYVVELVNFTGTLTIDDFM